MRHEPKVTPGARDDVSCAVAYYNAQRRNLGYEFLDELEHTTSFIRDTPLLSTLVDDPIRRVLLRRFPYGVFYVPGEGQGPDIVVAVLDLRQDPEAIRRAFGR